ncbi:MAG: hypothetical protein GWN01_00630 [Nitrosopumilaceae archaeon]|nr:hypothetical protein [Nitrosopumilaceae archaeon]NIT99486.1 hypothetical protein [Nitrosopumilaceae archaeon]NIU85845.1 hypothetical protein [Nitrosopumilaceae archaeon]NIV64702.1 hypothetical protein [Nitrosopumilaceae archaeon]NIX60089.1 hypothetical protein [Nitrosopumilaceae archaeon]
MVEQNFAGNIIINLASLPDFLRKPILKKRMNEFFSMSKEEKQEIINNALEAGPSIPFPNFAKLFKTWLEILTEFSEQQRKDLFANYIDEVSRSPQKLVPYNLDGILEIFLSLDGSKKDTLSKTIREIISGINENDKRKLFLMVPDNAKREIGI